MVGCGRISDLRGRRTIMGIAGGVRSIDDPPGIRKRRAEGRCVQGHRAVQGGIRFSRSSRGRKTVRARRGLSRHRQPQISDQDRRDRNVLPAVKVDTPRKVEFGEFSRMVISDSAVAFAGMDTFSSRREGKTTERPARFTFLVTKGDHGWSIQHFHSSWLPGQ